MRLIPALAALVALLVPVAAEGRPPRSRTLVTGWEVNAVPAKPAPPQPPPPEEGTGTESSAAPVTASRVRSSATPGFEAVSLPNVFDPIARRNEYPGQVRVYRLSFIGPSTPRGFRWLLNFEGVRRNARVTLNGRRIGGSRDPYVPFTLEARGLRANRPNTLVVLVDNRKDPKLAEGWWNWGGIIRPVRLVPAGRANLRELGVMSKVRCRGPASRCSSRLLVDGIMRKHGRGRIAPTVHVRVRAPGGRITRRNFRLRTQTRRDKAVRLSMRIPRPQLWSPESPRLYRVLVTVRQRGSLQQSVTKRTGLRQVQVKRGHLFLNNRPLQMRGASIHEDMPSRGTALSSRDNAQIVSDLKAVHANVTRAHYSLNEDLLSRLDRAGILVWNQVPVWQRDRLLGPRGHRARAYRQLEGTVKAGRSHPSVITHSTANELTYFPDRRTTTRIYLRTAAQKARRLDPTLPVSVDVKTGTRFGRQRTYTKYYDMIGLNQYFGWYNRSRRFEELPAYFNELRALYPRQALVMTEFGAEARPELAGADPERKGGYAFQTNYVRRNLQLARSLPYLSGAIYWTLREFEIFPGWTGGAGPRSGEKTRHNKGLMTYDGELKPAWFVARNNFAATPLYQR